MEEFFGPVAAAMVDTQRLLDERGLDSFDAFGESGVLPTVYTLSRLRLSCPVAIGLQPKRGAGEATAATLAPHGGGTLTLSFAYRPSPQGGDDPQPDL